MKAGFIETYVSEQLYNLCIRLQHIGAFSYDDIWSILEKTPESQTVIKMLINRMVIQKVAD